MSPERTRGSGRGGEALRMLRAPNPSPMTLDGTRTFLVGRGPGAVVDPGPADAGHLEAILSALGGERPAVILLTHRHPDHAGAAGPLADRTGAPVRAFDPAAGAPLRDGERVPVGGGELVAVATPGHTPDHASFLWRGAGAPAGGALFAGDLLMGEGDTALVAAPEGKVGDYLASLARVAALRPGVIYPAHGPPLTDPQAALARYRRHRRTRLDQVRAALGRGGGTLDELVAAVYGPELDPALRGPAAGSLRALLAHLEAGGEAERAGGGRWRAPAG